MNKQDVSEQIAALSERLRNINIAQQQVTDEIEALLRTQAEDNTEVVQEAVTNPRITDRDGTTLQQGQQVRLLTIGAFRGTTGTITKIGTAKVTIRLHRTGRSTTRNFDNVRVIQDA
jgi:transcription antitermination factor NusG